MNTLHNNGQVIHFDCIKEDNHGTKFFYCNHVYIGYVTKEIEIVEHEKVPNTFTIKKGGVEYWS